MVFSECERDAGDERGASDHAIKTDLASRDPWLPEKVAKKLRRLKRYR